MPGDLVLAVAENGERIVARVVQGAHTDGEWYVVTLCSPQDWATFEAGEAPDYWDEWRYDWPVEALEPMYERPGEAPGAVLARELEIDATHHREGRYLEIGNRVDDLYAALFPVSDDRSFEASVAYAFWDGWIDARNHGWQYYPGIAEDDWPRLADEIAESLRRGAPISNPALLARFTFRPQRSLWQRLRDRLRPNSGKN